MRPVLLIPGIHNSGPGHWQSLWEAAHPGVARVPQRDWDQPDCGEWAAGIDAAVRECAEPPVLVAHSLGCLALARWCEMATRSVQAVLLVAVPDPAGPRFPAQARGFQPPAGTLGARTAVLVSSGDDPYSSPAYSEACALRWQAEHIRLPAAGHINAESGLAHWPAGWALVERLRG
ncbi:MAG: alpha/beta fold hydrolase [Pseudomonadota bacterium]